MTARWHPDGVDSIITGVTPLAVPGDWAMVLVDGTFTETEFLAGQFADDIGGAVVAGPEPVAISAVTGGEVFADPTVFPAVTGADIYGIVIYHDTGTPATSPLLQFMDRQASSLIIAVTPDGTDIPVAFPSDRIGKL